MSAFTKVLIVFVCLLSAVFATSQVILYGKRENYGELYKQKAAEYADAVKARDDFQAKWKDALNKYDISQTTLSQQIAGLQSQLDAASKRANSLEAQLTEQALAVRQLTEVVQGKDADLKAKEDIIAQLNAALAERSSTIEANIAKIAALTKDVGENEATIGKLKNQLLDVQRERKELAESEADLKAKIGDLIARGINVAAELAPPITGRVVRVDNDLGVAVINKGAAAKVAPNTQFTIYNDTGYVASVVIHTVEEDLSVGKVLRLMDGKKLQSGDNATTQIQ